MQARSQDLEKGGGLFWKSEKCSNNLDSNFHWTWISFRRFVRKLRRNFLESSEIQRLFPPKVRCSPKKKKSLHWNWEWFFGRNFFFVFFRCSPKKKRSSLKLRVIFRPNFVIQRFFPPNIRWSPKKKRSSPQLRLIFCPILQIQTFEGGCFRMGGLFSIFPKKSASKAQKTCDFAYFTSQWGGSSPPAPPPPPLATLLYICDLVILYCC